ncbi:MAG TPA: glucose/galactose MFS transporter, partial [Porphyromonadaceae bacterium]|nr:glucose/galactose MFS transporter [Porphyromonadaceae bacterium]
MNQLTSSTPNKRTFYTSMAILAVMYFVFGLVSWVNSILIPYFKIALELTTHFQSYFVTFAFYIAYFVMAIPAGLLLNKVGYKKGIMYGFMFMSLGALIFVPAALTRQYSIFLVGLYCIGTGLAILQTAANPYVTIIGPIDRAAQRMSIMGVFNKFAGIVSPLIFAAVVFRSSDDATFALLEAGTLTEIEKNIILNDLIRRVILPYSVLAVL